MALTKIGATLGGSADVITVTQSSHGLTLGYPVKMTSSGYAHSTADSAANAEAVGIIIATTTNTLTIALGGRITVDGCVPNLTAGTVLFLQVSAGLLAAAEPSSVGQISKPMAVITIANSEMLMVQQRGEVVGTGTTTIADGSIDNDAMADNAINTDEIVDDAVTVAKLANSINTDIDANTAKVTNATHTGDVTGATGLTIAADAVTNAKLANMATRTVKANATSGSANPTDVVMADGDFLIANSSALVTVPITGDVVISNAGAATIQTDAVDIGMLSASGTASSSTFLRGDNAWAAAGGDLVFIGTVVATNDATITVTGLDTSVYEHFEIQFAGITPISDNTVLQFRMGDSGGIDSGASDYAWCKIRSDENGSRGATSDTSDEMIEIAEGLGNQVTEGYSGTLYINTGDLSGHTLIYGTGAVKIASETISLYLTYGMRLAALTLTQVQASINIGNVSTGRMTVWGRKHA